MARIHWPYANSFGRHDRFPDAPPGHWAEVWRKYVEANVGHRAVTEGQVLTCPHAVRVIDGKQDGKN